VVNGDEQKQLNADAHEQSQQFKGLVYWKVDSARRDVMMNEDTDTAVIGLQAGRPRLTMWSRTFVDAVVWKR